MAAGIMSAPGTDYGPCVDPCAHRDCAATRTRAASACITCQEPIGYETGYYVGDDGPEHAQCTWKRLGA